MPCHHTCADELRFACVYVHQWRMEYGFRAMSSSNDKSSAWSSTSSKPAIVGYRSLGPLLVGAVHCSPSIALFKIHFYFPLLRSLSRVSMSGALEPESAGPEGGVTLDHDTSATKPHATAPSTNPYVRFTFRDSNSPAQLCPHWVELSLSFYRVHRLENLKCLHLHRVIRGPHALSGCFCVLGSISPPFM